ncbi:hypothetical protein [Ovoidimarina sediminis]|nr:hypothetical protein [Rhodophyticola sp. MJ-SS7]MDU8942047.1 hypothetical protein [Rhodophyticola sp. MJ-SS7]
MKPMLLAFIAIAVIAAGADRALDYAGFSSGERGSAPSVRLD